MSINKVILLGNLGADPELRKTSSNNSVCTFSVATDRSRRDRNGTTEQQTEWHNIVCFGKAAEASAKYLKKGRQVYVEGRTQTEKWEDKTGTSRVSHKVVANVIQFIGRAPSGIEELDTHLGHTVESEPDFI